MCSPSKCTAPVRTIGHLKRSQLTYFVLLFSVLVCNIYGPIANVMFVNNMQKVPCIVMSILNILVRYSSSFIAFTYCFGGNGVSERKENQWTTNTRHQDFHVLVWNERKMTLYKGIMIQNKIQISTHETFDHLIYIKFSFQLQIIYFV